MMNFLRRPLFLSLLSVLLLSLPWLGCGGFWILGAFVPLLILGDRVKKGFLWWTALTLFLWIMVTCYWVSFATLIATAAVPLVGLCFMWPSWAIYRVASKRGGRALSYVLLVSGVVALEWLYSLGDVSFPWLTMGGAFAEQPWAVQWYAQTGVYGGSLWIMVSNLLIYTTLTRRKIIPVAVACVVLPVAASLAIYWSYQPPQQAIRVAIIQPNIDPYQKWHGANAQQQTSTLLSIAAKAPANTQFYIAPETAIISNVYLDHIASNADVARIQQFLRDRASGATFIVGATTADTEKFYNSALFIDTARVNVYHKSKLVMGVEVVPQWLAGVLESIDLGGYVGSLGRQPDREVVNGVGAAICYESIYGEYFAGWAAGGAEVMFVITNDGWWRDTPGYHQHFAFSRLRAVETNRAIARSANTGISALISPRGEVLQRLGWNRQGLITGELPVNKKLTLYTRAGDYIARLALYTYCLSLLYLFAIHFRRKI